MTLVEMLACKKDLTWSERCQITLFFSEHCCQVRCLRTAEIRDRLVKARVSGARRANLSDALHNSEHRVSYEAAPSGGRQWYLTDTGQDSVRQLLGPAADQIASQRRTKRSECIALLFLAVCPKDQRRLRLDEEHREIAQKIRDSEYRDAFAIRSAWAVRPDDVLQYLNEHKPNIVHISAHGSGAKGIVLEDKSGATKTVRASSWGKLFEGFASHVRLVVFNACESEDVAQQVTSHIDVAIGMAGPISDVSAIQFAASLYRAIGFGKPAAAAFREARISLIMESLPDDSVPTLLTRSGVDAEVLTFGDD